MDLALLRAPSDSLHSNRVAEGWVGELGGDDPTRSGVQSRATVKIRVAVMGSVDCWGGWVDGP